MSDLTWNGEAIERLIRRISMQAMHDGAEHILTESINECPVESGTLRRSGTVIDEDDSVVILYNVPYAEKQHEDLSLSHIDGKAKFLEDPYNRNKDRVIQLAKDRINSALRG